MKNKTEKNLIKCLVWFMDCVNIDKLTQELSKRGHKKELKLLEKNIEDNFYEFFGAEAKKNELSNKSNQLKKAGRMA